MRRLRTAAGTVSWGMALLLAGCHPAQHPATAAAKASADAADEARGVAEASLGKEAQILLQGDLARSGREQVLVVNPYSAGGAGGAGGANASAIFVMRAAVLEKSGGKWSEVLRCDEHLKNQNGYLGGSSSARVTGWRLEYNQDVQQALEMKFTPAEDFTAENGNADQSSEEKVPAFDVRWNKNAKRYQSYDQSHERYLNEIPSLETPQSILR